MRSPILITGCARSGTSMTAGIFHYCGAFSGQCSGPNKNNKKGMFENAQVRNALVKPYLRTLGVDPKGQKPLPNVAALNPFPLLDAKVEQIMKSQGYIDGPWMYKGAKMCLMWPLWVEAFPGAKWIIVRRKDEDIVYSCLKTGFMNAYQNEEGWQMWIDAHRERFEEMKNICEYKEVWPSKFIDGDFSEIKEALDWTNLSWNEELVKDFIDPKLYHRSV